MNRASVAAAFLLLVVCGSTSAATRIESAMNSGHLVVTHQETIFQRRTWAGVWLDVSMVDVRDGDSTTRGAKFEAHNSRHEKRYAYIDSDEATSLSQGLRAMAETLKRNERRSDDMSLETSNGIHIFLPRGNRKVIVVGITAPGETFIEATLLVKTRFGQDLLSWQEALSLADALDRLALAK